MSRKIYLILPLLLFVLMVASTGTAATSLTYVYDANGNLINGDGKYYEYNDANQLVKVKHGDQNGPVIAEYFYDYTGQRIKKIENGVTTYYIGKHFEKQVDSAGSATNTSYYFANGERVAKKDSLGNVTYYHSDHLGGTNVVTNSSGNLVERIKYYPFGEIREGGNEKYSFTGKEKDKLTDFYYFEARYYNSEFKHFTQADTLVYNLYDPQALNRYSYVRNNPLRYIDPSGHVWWNPFTWFKKENQAEPRINTAEPYKADDLSTVQLPTSNTSPTPKLVTVQGNDRYGTPHRFSDTSQCTSFIAEKYNITWSGNAGAWLNKAKSEGYAIGKTPQKGAIVVTNEDQDYGHVAIVEQLMTDEEGKEKIRISERNNPRWNRYREDRELFISSPKIQGYIYTEEYYKDAQ